MEEEKMNVERNDEPLLLWRRTVKHLRTMLSLAHKHRERLSEREEETIAAEVMVRAVPGAGRGLFAGRNFRKGELVFQEEPLVSASLLSESCCDCCLAYLSKTTNVPSKAEEREGGRDEGEEEARCIVCQRKEYCGEDCKASAHRKYHHWPENEMAMLLEEYPRLQRHLRMHGC
ncbi:SET and MYND domain-containing protein 5 [Balamuthia mandrillaris]